MEDSVAEEAEASNHEIDSEDEKKKGTIQIVKLEFTEADDEKETKRKNPQDTNPIPG